MISVLPEEEDDDALPVVAQPILTLRARVKDRAGAKDSARAEAKARGEEKDMDGTKVRANPGKEFTV